MVILHLSLLRKIMTCKESEDITLCIDLRSYSLKKKWRYCISWTIKQNHNENVCNMTRDGAHLKQVVNEACNIVKNCKMIMCLLWQNV